MVGVRRLEVITGVGGRRAWSHEDKGRIVAEAFAKAARVSDVPEEAIPPQTAPSTTKTGLQCEVGHNRRADPSP